LAAFALIATMFIDNAVGERRRLLVDADGAPFRLETERWSEAKRPRLDDIWFGRVGQRVPGGPERFVELGVGAAGVLATRASLHEGQNVLVRIKAEAWGEKGPLLSLQSGEAPREAGLGLIKRPAADPFLAGVEAVQTVEGEAARDAIDAAIEEASQPFVPFAAGATLTIEHTRALTAVDVDAGSATVRDRAALNLKASREIARQISLRGLAGLFVIDFLTDERPDRRRETAETLRRELERRLARRSTVLDVSELGLCEVSIARRQRGFWAAMAAAPAEERAALDLLRRLESEGWRNRGGRLRARVGEAAARWLAANDGLWRQAMRDRIGERWSFETVDGPAQAQVWSE
jgi:Ribonuclease G/E